MTLTESASPFLELSAVAARQHGMITAAQARRAGVGGAELSRLTESRLLMGLGWDVHQLAGSSTQPKYAYKYAAWLALDEERYAWERPAARHEDAVVSHGSACELLEISGPPSPLVEFTAPGGLDGALEGTTVRTAPLRADEVTVLGGVAVTTAHRTIVDLVRSWNDPEDVGAAMADAVRRDLVDLLRLHRDLSPLAAEYGFPETGSGFVDHFLTRLPVAALPPRNLAAYAALKYPDRVREAHAALVAAAENASGPFVRGRAFDTETAASVVGRAILDE